MKTNRMAMRGRLLALGLMVTACDDGQDVSETNVVTDLRAGMRALDDDGDPIQVSITVSE